MAGTMGRRRRFSQENLTRVPDESGVYELLGPQGEVLYVGMAGAGRVRERLLEHLRDEDVPGVTDFRVQMLRHVPVTLHNLRSN